MKLAEPGLICARDFGHLVSEGVWKKIWEWLKSFLSTEYVVIIEEFTKIFSRYTPRDASRLKQTIAERFTKLGEQTRTTKFVNDVMALPLNKAEDVRRLFKYLPFVITSLLGILVLFLCIFHFLLFFF